MTSATPELQGAPPATPRPSRASRAFWARVALLGACAAGWGVAAYLLSRTQIPGGLEVPDVDEAGLFAAEELREADRYERFFRINWAVSTAVLLAAFAAYARWGDRFVRESAAGRIGTGMLLAMLGFAIAWLAQLPFGIVQLWWDRRHDVADVGYPTWLVGNWIALGSEFVFVCLAILIVMGIAGWLRDRWWLLGGPVFVGIVVLFAFVFPYLLTSLDDLSDSQLAAQAEQLAVAQGVDDIPVKVQKVDEFTDDANAFAGGIGPSRVVVLWNTLLDGRFSSGEVGVVLSHEFAHHGRNHIWKGIAWYALFAIPGAYLVALWVRRRGSLYNAAAVPVALFIYVALNVALVPVDNVISRGYEAEADWIALETTRDPAAAQQLFENFSSTALQDPSPPAWAYVWLDSHPTLLQRIELVEAWKQREGLPDG